MGKTGITIPKKKVSEFYHRWKVVEFNLFGSVLRQDFRSESDVDVLVSFAPDAQVSLFDLVQMQIELESLFGRTVDIVEKDALRNPFRKRAILNSTQGIYAA